MTVPVSYYCPHCGTVVELERDGYLADKAVTPYPLEGWTYAAPDEDFEEVDGVRFVCGEDDGPHVSWRPAGSPPDADVPPDADAGCGEPFYLSFVRYEEGREVDPRRPSEHVELNVGEEPSGPRGPRGPGGPGFR